MTVQAPPAFVLLEDLAMTGLQAAVAEEHGAAYLVLEMPGQVGPCWVCAPASEAALAAVRCGRSSPWSVIHHSATGTVDIYRTLVDGSITQSVVLCGSLPTGDTLCAAEALPRTASGGRSRVRLTGRRSNSRPRKSSLGTP